MPTEQQELQLKVTLDDQASPQLEAIREAIGGLGASGGGGGKGRAIGGMGDLEKAMVGLIKSFAHVGQTATTLAKSMGPTPIVLGAMAYQMNRASESADSWSEALVKSGQSARQAGGDLAGFTAIVQAFARSGIDATTATKALIEFQEAVGELATPGNARLDDLINRIGSPQAAANIMISVRALTQANRIIDRANIAKNAQAQTYAQILKETHGDIARATYISHQVGMALGGAHFAMIEGQINELSKDRQTNLENEIKLATELHHARGSLKGAQSRFGALFGAATAPFLTWFDNAASRMLNRINRDLDVAETRARQKQERKDKGIPEPDTRVQDLKSMFPAMGGFGFDAFAQGGIVTGDTGPGGVIPLPRLGSGGMGREKIQTTNDQTQELTRLTTNIQRILRDPNLIRLGVVSIRRYAEGGTARGEQVAMVAEGDSPEAVTNVHGTRIYDQPSIGMLGRHGPATVAPLYPLTGQNVNKYVSGDTMRNIGESRTGKSSYFGNYQGKYTWNDPGDVYTRGPKKGQPLPAYTGAPPSLPGIALPTTVTAGPAEKQQGEWFEVKLPNGQIVYAPQTDVGPGKGAKGRNIDINAALAERAGYVPENVKGGQHYPTDALVTSTLVDPERALWMGQPGMPAPGVTPATTKEALAKFPMPDTSLADQPIRIPPAEQMPPAGKIDLRSALGEPGDVIPKAGTSAQTSAQGFPSWGGPEVDPFAGNAEASKKYWENITSQPVQDIQKDFDAARSKVRQTYSDVGKAQDLPPTETLPEGFESGGAEGYGVPLQKGVALAKAGAATVELATSPATSFLNTTLGRVGGLFGGSREAGEKVGEAVQSFVPILPSGPLSKAVSAGKFITETVGGVEASQDLWNILHYGAKAVEAGSAVLGEQLAPVIAPAFGQAKAASVQQLDRMMSNPLRVAGRNQIKIEQENPPPGTEIETDGALQDATKETTSYPPSQPAPPPRYDATSTRRQKEQSDAERDLQQPREYAGT